MNTPTIDKCPKCGGEMGPGRKMTDRAGEPIKQMFVCRKCAYNEWRPISRNSAIDVNNQDD